MEIKLQGVVQDGSLLATFVGVVLRPTVSLLGDGSVDLVVDGKIVRLAARELAVAAAAAAELVRVPPVQVTYPLGGLRVDYSGSAPF